MNLLYPETSWLNKFPIGIANSRGIRKCGSMWYNLSKKNYKTFDLLLNKPFTTAININIRFSSSSFNIDLRLTNFRFMLEFLFSLFLRIFSILNVYTNITTFNSLLDFHKIWLERENQDNLIERCYEHETIIGISLVGFCLFTFHGNKAFFVRDAN